MLDENQNDTSTTQAEVTAETRDGSPAETAGVPAKKAAKRAPRKSAARPAKKAAAAADDGDGDAPAPQSAHDTADAADGADAPPPAKKAAAKRAPARRAAAKKSAARTPEEAAPGEAATGETTTGETTTGETTTGETAASEPTAPVKRTRTRKATAKKTAPAAPGDEAAASEQQPALDTSETPADALAEGLASTPAPDVDTAADTGPAAATTGARRGGTRKRPAAAPSLLFQTPDPVAAPTRRRRASAKPAADEVTADAPDVDETETPAETPGGTTAETPDETTDETTVEAAEEAVAPARASGRSVGRRSSRSRSGSDAITASEPTPDEEDSDEDRSDDDQSGSGDSDEDRGDADDEQGGNRRRRRRGGRRRRKSGGDDASGSADGDTGDDDTADTADQEDQPAPQRSGQSGGRGGRGQGGNGRGGQQGGNGQQAGHQSADADEDEAGDGTGSRRRRRRRRSGEDGDGGSDDPQNTVTRVRKPRTAEDEITSLHGSTRLEAKKQRRREGREAGRRRAPIVSEAEFLARREAVDRVMVIRQHADLTQIAVLEDKVLVEHYVARESQTSLIGNVYLGRVQNVLPSMEAAFIDIGKGRNAVLYAGEVNWDSLGAGNGPRKIEQVLKSGQPILVQVSKDPIGHKGARLTSQISLPGRFLVYVPDGTTSGISRKLPDTERTRLKTLLKEIVPDSAGVIVRTAAEGASEEELTLDVERLTARWAEIESKVGKGNAPQLLYGEPDLTLKVVRDLFTEDFGRLVVSGDEAWDLVDTYVQHVAPDLAERLERYDGDEDIFAAYRIDEQIAKGLDRKVWLPSGGSLVIDRTEAMTVVDVNTGKFTGSGGNLEETVTKNNLEAAEEIVRQLRLRDIGGIVVVDFIDMVLESNRDLVLRRLVECLGRDRTRHQVAEVTSLGLVQMTRKRIGTGLLEAFSENCEHCAGRGVVVQHEPVEPRRGGQDEEPRRGRRTRGRGDEQSNGDGTGNAPKASPSPKDLAALAKHEPRPAESPAPAQPEPADAAAQSESVDRAPAPSESVDEAPAPSEFVDRAPAQSESVDRAPAQAGSVDEAPAQPEAAAEAAAPVPQGPRLVTSTRRRVVRRPAGSADPQPAPAGADDVAATTTPAAPAAAPAGDTDAASATGAPAAEQAPTPGGSADAVETPAPRLVTSSRRRVARRPAGPPVSGSEAGPDGSGPVDEDGSAGEGDDDESSPHVPVKRKRARRH